MKKETRGRKPSGGRKRNEAFSGKFTRSENEEIREAAKVFEMSQSDVVITAVRRLRSDKN